MPHKPDFFIVGAPKCGTTTLYSWLKDHPDIFMPQEKEPHYFAQALSNRYCRVRDENSYLNLFSDKKENQICGEASVLYGFSPDSIKAILEFNPEAKIILMMRHPIDMIVSYHGQLLVNLEEDVKLFEQAWNLQSERSKGKGIPDISTDPDLLQYSDIGRLGAHLKAIVEIVPSNQLKVICLDDLARNPKEIYADVIEFLGKKDDGRIAFNKENEASAIKYQWLEKARRSQNVFMKFIKSFIKLLPSSNKLLQFNEARREHIILNDVTLNSLYDHFGDDILYLENYFGQKLKTKYERSS